MSDKLRMIAIDKVPITFLGAIETKVAIEKASKVTGISESALINGWVRDSIAKSKITLDEVDIARCKELMEKNLQKRNTQKAKKGIK